tara:strand:- start:474 stop:680 length:207 start_codon:yes stop_codon:yes gene_type:complete
MKKVNLRFVVGLFAISTIKAQMESGKMLLGASSVFAFGGSPANGTNMMTLGYSATKKRVMIRIFPAQP